MTIRFLIPAIVSCTNAYAKVLRIFDSATSNYLFIFLPRGCLLPPGKAMRTQHKPLIGTEQRRFQIKTYMPSCGMIKLFIPGGGCREHARKGVLCRRKQHKGV